jgi:hypothetical protein
VRGNLEFLCEISKRLHACVVVRVTCATQ